MASVKFSSVKGQGTSIGAIIGLVLVALVVVIVIIFMTTNNPFSFFKFLPSFNSSDDIDDDILEAREMLREANNNPSKIRAYDCKVTEKGVCLNEDDYRMLEAERPIDELIYCSQGEYCFDNKEGCIIEEPENVLLKCYNYFEEHEKLNTDDYRLPKVCENKNAAEPLERNCVCLDEEGYEYYFVEDNSMKNNYESAKIMNLKFIIDGEERHVSDEKSYINFLAYSKINKQKIAIDLDLRENYFDDFLKNVEICNQGEYCDFGGEGCADEIIKRNPDNKEDLTNKNSEEEKGFLEKVKDFFSF